MRNKGDRRYLIFFFFFRLFILHSSNMYIVFHFIEKLPALHSWLFTGLPWSMPNAEQYWSKFWNRSEMLLNTNLYYWSTFHGNSNKTLISVDQHWAFIGGVLSIKTCLWHLRFFPFHNMSRHVHRINLKYSTISNFHSQRTSPIR